MGIDNTALCSVVMVSYHTGAPLLPSIRRVLAQDGLAELILVDNGNDEKTLAVLRDLASRHNKFILVTGQGNVGFARGCNLGAAKASGEFLLLLNPDCLLPERALTDTMQTLQTHNAMLAGCNLLNPDGTPQRGSRRALLTPKNAAMEALQLHRFFSFSFPLKGGGLGWGSGASSITEVTKEDGDPLLNPPPFRGRKNSDASAKFNMHYEDMPDRVIQVPAISGAFMCMRRADYTTLGGMDERYFLHVEDLDFCMRVHKAGGKTIFMPYVRVVHILSTSKAPSAAVERHKRNGFRLYFQTHFADSPAWQLTLLEAGAYARYLLRSYGSWLRPKRNDQAALRLMLLASYETDTAADDRLAGKTFLVTGSVSQVGVCIIGRLLQAGAHVYAFTHYSTVAYAHPHLYWLEYECTTVKPLGIKAEHAVHCAPLWLLPDMLPHLQAAGVKSMAAIGSTTQFAKAGSTNAAEQNIVQMLTQAETRLNTECGALRMRCTVVRPTLIYGAGLDRNVASLGRLIRRLGMVPVYPPASGRRRPIHAEDVAALCVNACVQEGPQYRALNVGGGETLTYRQMVERIFQALGRTPRIIPLPFLPRLLDFAARIRQNGLVNGDMARRMNMDQHFGDDDAMQQLNVTPRAFLAGGRRDVFGVEL